jgi:3-dehydroquinate synthase
MKQNIVSGTDALGKLSELITKSSASVFVVCDENTLRCCYPLAAKFLPPHQIITIQAGEEHKTLSACEGIWTYLTKHKAERGSVLINLGGGMLCDLGGFAAGCYKRGIQFINIPTTLLAMVDASVGGKTGIDFGGYKNQIGLFYHPLAVIIHAEFLKTLPDREVISGLAEVIKHYLIADKEAFVEMHDSKLPVRAYLDDAVVARNIAIKQHITELDPLEKGPRKALNFGHTVGHAVESYFLAQGEDKLLHGEAVAIGTICESYISHLTGTISTNELADIDKVILHYFKLPAIPITAINDIMKMMLQDKKNEQGKIKFTLLNGIGNYNFDIIVDDDVIARSLQYYNSLHT